MDSVWLSVFIDDECIRARIRSQIFSSSVKLNSSSQSAFSGRVEGDCFVLIIVKILEITPFKDIWRYNTSSIFLIGKKGKLENCLWIKFHILKYENKLSVNFFFLKLCKGYKLLSMYSWPTVTRPCSLQKLKDSYIKEGGNYILRKNRHNSPRLFKAQC